MSRSDSGAFRPLLLQVQRVARAISSNGVPFRSFLMTGGEADDKERNKKVGGGVVVVVGVVVVCACVRTRVVVVAWHVGSRLRLLLHM
jgi:hypothetical protein